MTGILAENGGLTIAAKNFVDPKILFLNRQDAKNAKKNMKLENLSRSPSRLAQYISQLADSLGVLGG